jgi:hypothetical protein
VNPHGPTVDQLHEWWTMATATRDRLCTEASALRSALAAKRKLADDTSTYADQLRTLALNLYPAALDDPRWR